MNKSTRYSPEARERAVHLYDSDLADADEIIRITDAMFTGNYKEQVTGATPPPAG